MPKKKSPNASRTTIQAKPTKYLGREYKSRLEAQWAVLFEHHPLVDVALYEDRTFHHPETGWNYTPDFFIKVGNVTKGFLEIKPTLPTKEWLMNTATFVEIMDAPLWVAIGSFFRGVPTFHLLTPKGKLSTEGFLGPVLLSHREVLAKVRGFRFDLDNGHAKFRQGNQAALDKHVAAWKRAEKKKNKP